MVSFNSKGDFSNLTGYLERVKNVLHLGALHKYGQKGVKALQDATPVDSGLTASSWYYTIEHSGDTASITFHNSNIQDGVQIAVILQYGHATRNGGWVEGRDYINPAIQPIFDKIVEDAWKEVTKV